MKLRFLIDEDCPLSLETLLKDKGHDAIHVKTFYNPRYSTIPQYQKRGKIYMTDEQEQLIAKASNSIKAAQILFNEEIYDVSTSRAYYAMFYLAEAFLISEGLSFSKHFFLSPLSFYYFNLHSAGLLGKKIFTTKE